MGRIEKAFIKLPFVGQFAIGTCMLVASAIFVRGMYNYYSGMVMNRYRDKSALYGRELKPGERPSWPTWP